MPKVNRESPGASCGYSATSLWFNSVKIEILTLSLEHCTVYKQRVRILRRICILTADRNEA